MLVALDSIASHPHSQFKDLLGLRARSPAAQV
jgi:hypothetical protein